MPQFSFGSGSVFAVPGAGDITPVQLGTLQDISVDFDFSTKQLTGQYQFPVAVARSSGKVSGKAKAASFSAKAFNLVFGQTLTTGSQTMVAGGEAATIASASYTSVNASSFVSDLGVLYAATGKPFSKVASSPATGQYSVNAATGVYSFASGDNGSAILVNYSYTAASGSKITLSNQLMGVQPVVKLVLSEGWNGNNLELELNQVIFSKLSLNFKNEDWTVPELDFQAFADASNNIGAISLTAA